VLQNLFWILSSSFELFAGILLALSIFRFPIQFFYVRIAVFSILLGVVIFYAYNVLEFRSMIIVTDIFLITVFYTLSLQKTFFKSLLISILGVFICVVVEIVAFFIIVGLGFAETQDIASNKWLGASNLFVAGILLSFTTYLLQKFKIGFLIEQKHFPSKKYLHPYNYVFSTITLLVIIGIMFLNSQSDNFTYRLITFGFMSTSSCALIWYMYLQNKRLFNHRYEQFNQILNKTGEK
jgi:hypothetical protein